MDDELLMMGNQESLNFSWGGKMNLGERVVDESGSDLYNKCSLLH